MGLKGRRLREQRHESDIVSLFRSRLRLFVLGRIVAPMSETLSKLSRALGAKYEVKRLVGSGGFAEVYEVWDKELERRLAVKVLRPDRALPARDARSRPARASQHPADPLRRRRRRARVLCNALRRWTLVG